VNFFGLFLKRFLRSFKLSTGYKSYHGILTIMRSIITVRKISSAPLHYDYQYGLASMLYTRLATANITLANEIHSHQGFKFYTFSNLLIKDWIPDKKGLNFTSASFIISSPDTEFIRSFAEGLLMNAEFSLERDKKSVDFIIETIEILPQHTPGETCVFKTLSPIYIKTMRKHDGRLVEVDLYPKDPKFYENLHTNLTARYKEFYGFEVEQDHFEVTEINNVKPKRISIGNSQRRCSHMMLTVQGDTDLISFGYEAGLGEKNAMGFGCVKILD
jgi:CRISPR-associated endoribonuclease Cas6